jgi:hypothetical protein
LIAIELACPGPWLQQMLAVFRSENPEEVYFAMGPDVINLSHSIFMQFNVESCGTSMK